jgi:iduronate 2-sulfatase
MNNVMDTWRAATAAEIREAPLPDQEIAQQAIGHLRNFADDARTGKRNFFVAVGFHKPHLPWVFPEEFLELYPTDAVDVPSNKFLSWMMPESAYTTSHEFPLFNDVKKLNLSGRLNETYPDEFTKKLRRAYFACVSYIDSLVGMLLKEVDDLGLAQNTLVVFLGDHGFHLGEGNHWGKHTNFEQGAHAPLMLNIPGRTDRGMVSNSLVEFVDIYPTVVEAAGLGTIPSCPKVSRDIKVCTDGSSFVALLNNPDLPLKDAAFSQMPRDESMGYSIRTDRYRYTEWVPLEKMKSSSSLFNYIISWDNVLGAELYDHEEDQEEQYNRATDTRYRQTCKMLSKQLRAFVGNTIENATVKLP